MTATPQEFAAFAYQPRTRDEWVQGVCRLEHYRLRFHSDALVLEIPLVSLEIELDKSGDRQVRFRDSNRPESCICTYELSILRHPALLEQAHTRNQIQALESLSELKKRLRITGFFLAGFAALTVVVWLLTGLMVKSLVARIPPELEQELGDSALAELKAKEALVEDPKQQAMLDRVGRRLLSALPTNGNGYKFYIVQRPLPNAFALPGGHVVVTTRLLEMADRPEEVAGVLAHEIAHVRLKHHFRKAISSAGPYLICSLFMRGGNGMLGMLGGGSQLLVAQSFSQEYELEADEAGWNSLIAARIDPRPLAVMLQKLEDDQHRQRTLSPTPGALSSHPATTKRIHRLEANWRKLKDKPAFDDLGKTE